MTQYYGDFAEDDTVLIPFNTFDSNDPSNSVTITNLADADIKVHKDGNTAEIATDGATVAIDFDSRTGAHLITIDTSVDAAYSTGSEYAVLIEGTDVDGGTVTSWVGAFSIERAGGALALLKTLTTAVADIPTVAEFNARSIISADYVVVGDTIAGVTAVVDVTGDVKGNVDGTVTGKTPAEAGDAMNLAADAIKAVSYDESTAFPLTAVNGSTLTEAGGDGDHLLEAGGDGDHLTAINLPNQTMDIIGDITGNLSGSVGSNTELGPAEVNAEVLDVLNVDTFDEPGDEELAVNTTLINKIGYLYKFLRNKIETTATRIHVYNAAEDNKDQSAIISDDATTFTRGEFGAGD